MHAPAHAHQPLWSLLSKWLAACRAKPQVQARTHLYSSRRLSVNGFCVLPASTMSVPVAVLCGHAFTFGIK